MVALCTHQRGCIVLLRRAGCLLRARSTVERRLRGSRELILLGLGWRLLGAAVERGTWGLCRAIASGGVHNGACERHAPGQRPGQSCATANARPGARRQRHAAALVGDEAEGLGDGEDDAVAGDGARGEQATADRTEAQAYGTDVDARCPCQLAELPKRAAAAAVRVGKPQAARLLNCGRSRALY